MPRYRFKFDGQPFEASSADELADRMLERLPPPATRDAKLEVLSDAPGPGLPTGSWLTVAYVEQSKRGFDMIRHRVGTLWDTADLLIAHDVGPD